MALIFVIAITNSKTRHPDEYAKHCPENIARSSTGRNNQSVQVFKVDMPGQTSVFLVYL